MSEETIEKLFTVEGIPTVRIENVNGTITVRPGAAGAVAVKAVRHGTGAPVEIWQDDDGSVHAKSRPKGNQFFGLDMSFGKTKVDFDVSVPAETNLTVKAVNGNADVEGVRGEVSLGTVNGAIAVRNVSGELKFDTVNGKISGGGLAGQAFFKTVNGAIELTGSDLPALTAKTVNGNIRLDTPIGEGPYELKTVSGNVRIKTGEAPKGRVHFKSVNGSVRVNDQRVRSNGGRDYGPSSKVYELGEGGPEIRFTSVSGNLEFLSDSDIAIRPAAAGAAPSAKTAPAPDLMSILDKISSGELSVEEGIAELESA